MKSSPCCESTGTSKTKLITDPLDVLSARLVFLSFLDRSEMASKRKAGESLSPLTGQSKVSRQSSSGKAAKEEGSIQDLLQRMCDRQERQFDALTAQLADVQQQQQSALGTSFTQLEENCKLAIATSEEAKKKSRRPDNETHTTRKPFRVNLKPACRHDRPAPLGHCA